MKRLIITALLAFACTSTVVAQDVPEAPAKPELATFAAPKVAEEVTQTIVKRNIFLGDRAAVTRAAQPRPTTTPTPPRDTTTQTVAPPPPPPPADPDASFVLVGVTVLDGKPTAFIEDRNGGLLRKVDETGPFSKGDITAIDLNSVTYVIGEETRTINVRFAFTGKEPAPRSSLFSNSTSTTASSSDGAASPDSGSATSSGDSSSGGQRTMSLLERMRLRRQQESQQSPPRE